MTEKTRSKQRVNDTAPKANLQSACAAEPTLFAFSDERPLLNVTASAVNNVARSQSVLAQTIRVFLSDTDDSIFNDSVLPNVGRHDGRDAL